MANADQADGNNDGIGDVCEPSAEGMALEGSSCTWSPGPRASASGLVALTAIAAALASRRRAARRASPS
jgi:hypothetical protein